MPANLSTEEKIEMNDKA
ncbi:hypothetical protein A2U01_0085983, partial [Trifolium medium]|nr:hypothetical protein [Trifolium medium]